jgi:hypothetical protein
MKEDTKQSLEKLYADDAAKKTEAQEAERKKREEAEVDAPAYIALIDTVVAPAMKEYADFVKPKGTRVEFKHSTQEIHSAFLRIGKKSMTFTRRETGKVTISRTDAGKDTHTSTNHNYDAITEEFLEREFSSLVRDALADKES